MKLIYLLLFFVFLSTSTTLFAQQITYSAKGVPLKTIFSVIQKQTGYGFFYDPKLLNRAKPVSLAVKNTSLPEVLAIVFKNQPLEYNIENKTILVSGKKLPAKSKVIPKAKNMGQEKKNVSGNEVENTVPPASAKSQSFLDTLTSNPVFATPLVLNPSLHNAVPNDAVYPKQDKSMPSQISSSIIKWSGYDPKLFRIRPFELLNYQKVTFGVKGGLTRSRSNDGQNGSSSADFYLGFFADKQMTSKFNLGTELSFALLGRKNQFEIPLHVKYYLNERWNVLSGPKLDIIGRRHGSTREVGVSAEVGSQYQINQIFFAEARYAKAFIDGDKNVLRLGIGANFSKKEFTEKTIRESEPLRLRIALNSGIALNDPYVAVGGIDLRIQDYLKGSIAGTLTAGYFHYWWETEDKGFMSYIPVKAGLKFFAAKPFYIAPEAGFAFGMNSEGSMRPFLFAGGIGAQMNNGFDIGLRYENMTGTLYKYYLGMPDIPRPSFVALRVEYGFNLSPLKSQSGEFTKARTEPLPTNSRKKSVFIELMGNGFGATANFDMRFKRNQNDGLGFSAGAGITTGALTFPLMLNYIAGKRRSSFEGNIGFSNFYSSGRNEVFYFDDDMSDNNTQFVVAPVMSAGYRLQTYKGLQLRAYLSAISAGFYYDKGIKNDGLFIISFPGISVGYSLK